MEIDTIDSYDMCSLLQLMERHDGMCYTESACGGAAWLGTALARHFDVQMRPVFLLKRGRAL